MARRNEKKPHIPQTEILSLAIDQINVRIERYQSKITDKVDEKGRALIQSMIDPWVQKRELLLQMYEIETGSDYGLGYD